MATSNACPTLYVMPSRKQQRCRVVELSESIQKLRKDTAILRHSITVTRRLVEQKIREDRIELRRLERERRKTAGRVNLLLRGFARFC